MCCPIFKTLRFVLVSCSGGVIMWNVCVAVVSIVQYTEYLLFGFKLALISSLLFFFSDGGDGVDDVLVFLCNGVHYRVCLLMMLSKLINKHVFDIDQHHQQANTVHFSKSGFRLGKLLRPIFVHFVHLCWCF